MTTAAIQVDRVWKKFRKGEVHDSLRDLIPAMLKRVVGGSPRGELRQREFWALQDVSFEVPRGASLGIIGPNGAGKSTMLKLLSRIIRPNRGACRVNGRLSALIEVGAGFHQDLTGRENIYLNGTILGMSRREIRDKEERIIDFAGVEEFIDTPVKRYSSGMKARLGFAVAAHLEPDVLLVDEVLAVGDARFRAKCINYMHNLVRSNVTVVFISHSLDQVRELCPTTLVLDRGQTVFHGPTDRAIRVYLDRLGAAAGNSAEAQKPTEAEIRNIRLADEEGREVMEWTVRRPAVVEFELVLHQRLEHPSVLIGFATIDGVYLGTANTRLQNVEVPREPGTYRMRFRLDPMPLADGDYTVELRIHDGLPPNEKCLWTTRQPRTVTIRGSDLIWSIITCDGQWQVQNGG